jgi:hypothetical protein
MTSRIPRRGAVYYVQQAIPLDLQAEWGAKQEWKSLRTKELSEAKPRHHQAKLDYLAKFDAMRSVRAKSSPSSKVSASEVAAAEYQVSEEMDRYWAEHDAELEADPDRQVRVAHTAMLREQLANREWALEVKAEERKSARAKGTSLTAVVEKWAAHSGNTPKTIDRMKSVVKWFEDYMGRLPVEAITPEDMKSFRDKLLDNTTAANAKTKFQNFNTVLRYAQLRLNLIKTNPAAGLLIEVRRKPGQRRLNFDDLALKAIFGSPVYAENIRPAGGAGEAAYWLPLLALYTGARENELGQLRPMDIMQEQYVDGC